MKNLEDSLDMIYHVLTSLTTLAANQTSLKQKEELMKDIENLEEARRLLYDAKNDFQKLIT